MALLSIENMEVAFGKEPPVVKGINIQVEQGRLTAVVGESGSGKSVTAMSVLQLLPPSVVYANGRIIFQENNEMANHLIAASKAQLQALRGNRIAMIFQEPMSSLNPVMTCGKQVAEAILQHQNVSSSQARQQTIDWFQKVQLPDPATMYNRYPHQVSGGQKQRVMIAMAMSCSPALLICDEPTTALDVTVQKQILQLIKSLQLQNNMGVLFITHDLGLVSEIADEVVVMYKGSIVEKDSLQKVFQQPEHPYTKALLACRPVLYSKGDRLPVVSDFLSGKAELVTNGKVVKPAENAVGIKAPPSIEAPEKQVLIEVKNLQVSFTTKRNLFGKTVATYDAVKEVSFSIYKGETLGLVGESGCGKTTLGRTLLQLIPATSGDIFYERKNWKNAASAEQKAIRRNMQIVFQDPFGSLNPRLTVGQALLEPLQVHSASLSAAQRRAKAVEWLEKVSLKAEHLNRYPHQFSGGQRQRIVIARALILNPAFVVCDESVSALDVSVQAQVLNLLNDLKAELNFTCLFISHDLGVVHYLSDRILVMNKGRMEEEGTAEAIYHHPQSDYTKRLIAAIPKGLTG